MLYWLPLPLGAFCLFMATWIYLHWGRLLLIHFMTQVMCVSTSSSKLIGLHLWVFFLVILVYVANAIEIEVLAVLEAVRNAQSKGWLQLWLKTESSLVGHYFKQPRSVLWHFRTPWANCLHILYQIYFHISHVYRKGNCVANTLANFGAEHIC